MICGAQTLTQVHHELKIEEKNSREVMIMRVLQNKIQPVMYRGLLHQNGRLSASKSDGVDGLRSRNVLKERKKFSHH